MSSHEDLDKQLLKVVEKDEKRRQPRPDDLVWNVLILHFGEPRTRTEASMFGKVVRELMEAACTTDEVDKTCKYVLRQFDSPSVMAVAKWFATAQRQTPISPQQQAIANLRDPS